MKQLRKLFPILCIICLLLTACDQAEQMPEIVDASAGEPMAETTEEEPPVRPINVFPERPIELTPESTPCIYWK